MCFSQGYVCASQHKPLKESNLSDSILLQRVFFFFNLLEILLSLELWWHTPQDKYLINDLCARGGPARAHVLLARAHHCKSHLIMMIRRAEGWVMRGSEGGRQKQRRRRERVRERERERETNTHTGWREDGGKTGRVVDGWFYRGHNSYQQTSSTQLKNDDASLTLSH